MKNRIQENINNSEQLELHYRADKKGFEKAFFEIYPDISDQKISDFWKIRLEYENKNPVVVGIGEFLWDMLPDGKKVGGAPVNFVHHASLLGAYGYAISAGGKDSLGNEIMEVVERIGINLMIEKVDYPTGTVQVQLEEGVPTYNITQGVAWDNIPITHREMEIARKTKAVCFGTLAQRSSVSKDSIRKFLSLTPEGAYRILDLNLRSPFYSDQIIKESISLCNILKLNEEELEVIKSIYQLHNMDEQESCRWLMNAYPLQYLVITAGDKYSMIFSPDALSYLKTPKVKVVDTVGAGDSFTAAFVMSLLQGKTLEHAHAKAVEVSALVCQVAGAWL